MRPDAATRGPRVFFYVQHLLGIGHLHRAARIAKALAADGCEVRLVLGGRPTAGLDIGAAALVQLSPVMAGAAGFSALVHPDGTAFGADDQAKRAAALVDAFERFAPDVLITEAFPFGRRQMRFELLPLLARARSRAHPPLIAASVRDILQRNPRPERSAETVDLVARFFDLVLVHGDPALTRLDDTFPDASRFGPKIVYTGLVAPDPPERGPSSLAAVVSAGGGAVGGALLQAALRARPLTRIAERPWLVLAGPNLPAGDQALLDRAGADSVRVERFVPDLAQVLAMADLSVSQAGYNTVADILVSGCRAVLVPYGRDGETEQSDRASILARRGAAVTVAEEALTPERLAAAIDQALELPRTALDLELDGARAASRAIRLRLAQQAEGAHPF